jgi:TolB protein
MKKFLIVLALSHSIFLFAQNPIDKFVFVSKQTGYSQIYTFHNGKTKQLTFKDDNRRPKLSPDGKTIAFESERDGKYQIYTIELDGSNEQNFSKNNFNEGGGNWSPDGKNVVFYSSREGNGDDEIFLKNLKTGKVEQLTDNDYDDWRPSFSKDGKYVVYSGEKDGNEEVFKINIKTKEVTQLTNAKGRDGWATFNKKGDKILFHSERTGRSEIWEMDSNGNNQKQLTSFDGDGFKPCYVYDGKVVKGILYASEENNHNDWDIVYLDYKTKQIVKVIDSSSRDYEPHYYSF